MEQPREPARAYVELDGVRVWAPDGTDLLRGVTWRVRAGEHWALLGPNGAGKTTLLSMAGARRHPSAGTVRVLGERLGNVDVRELRRLIGVVDGALTGEAVSACFGLGVEVQRHDGRWLATMTGPADACLAGPPHHMVS